MQQEGLSSGFKGLQSQDQPQGEASDGIWLRVWSTDWTGPQGPILAQENENVPFFTCHSIEDKINKY